jgi:hypothetical protein
MIMKHRAGFESIVGDRATLELTPGLSREDRWTEAFEFGRPILNENRQEIPPSSACPKATIDCRIPQAGPIRFSELAR